MRAIAPSCAARERPTAEGWTGRVPLATPQTALSRRRSICLSCRHDRRRASPPALATNTRKQLSPFVAPSASPVATTAAASPPALATSTRAQRPNAIFVSPTPPPFWPDLMRVTHARPLNPAALDSALALAQTRTRTRTS